MNSQCTHGPMTTLHDFESVLGRPLNTSFELLQLHGSWLVCEVAFTFSPIRSNDEHEIMCMRSPHDINMPTFYPPKKAPKQKRKGKRGLAPSLPPPFPPEGPLASLA